MAKKKMQKIDLENFFIYSDEPKEEVVEAVHTPDPTQQKLYVRKERKGRGGKVVSLVEGFVGSDEALELLGKRIKQHCGTGGSSKDGVVMIQGDLADKIVQFLVQEGYSVKKTTM